MKKTDLIKAGAELAKYTISYTTAQAKVCRTARRACLKLATVLDVIGSVEGESPDTVQSATAVIKLRSLLGLKAAKTANRKADPKPNTETRAEEVDPASEMTCGKPPYVAEIVRASGTGTLWTAPVRYRSEHAAEIAIILRATLLKHRCSGLSRHWVTGNAEHMIDYGSHLYYGRIMSAENWMAMKREAK